MPEYFATKYDSAAAEVIALLSDEAEGYGNRDDSTGDVDAPTGYFALIVLDESTPLDFENFESCAADDRAGETAREYGVTAPDVIGAHIVTTNSQGFVSIETFETAGKAREEYDCRAARYAEWSDEERDEDSDGVYICPVTGHGYHSL